MEEQAITGKIYDIQGFSVQDGPGIRTTVFLKGCPLRCPWCHSPESQSFQPQLSWMEMHCLGAENCGNCLKSCPRDALSPGKLVVSPATQERKHVITIDRSKCVECGSCVEACLPKALYFCGKDYTVEEAVERVEKDRLFYEHSGGGVTLSGGEPLCQPQFSVAFLKACHERGLNTALDTTGYADSKWIDAILPYTDLFLYDLKHMDSKCHEEVIGVPNDRILDNAKRIAANGGKMQIRMPIIPGFNDGEAVIHKAGAFIRELGPEAVPTVQLLPYHAMGSTKYLRIDKEYTMDDVKPPSDEWMQRCKGILQGYGLAVTIH